jgi:hypothetical protein
MVKEHVDKTNEIDKNLNRGNENQLFKNSIFKAKGRSEKGNLLTFSCIVRSLGCRDLKILFKK